MPATTPDLAAVRTILRRHLPATRHRAVLFGSRARGTARPTSDWDVGVVGPAPLAGAILQRVREEIEALPTLHTIDLVDLAAVPDAFRANALKDAVELT